jgi:two-component system alkaline phosphatase synthesis response regulator PhoP
MKTRILIVDDEQDIIEFLQYNLEQNGYDVFTSNNGIGALEKLKENPDLIVLDIMMPEMDGYEVCKRIREIDQFKNIPVLFLTARSSEIDEVHGLNIGADDYIQKPASIEKILARINANLRKSKSAGSIIERKSTVEVGPLVIDQEQYQVKLNGDELVLPRKEFEILLLLAGKPGKVFDRNQILDKIWGEDIYVVARTIDVHIRKIREKLGDESGLIETIKGVGYRFRKID